MKNAAAVKTPLLTTLLLLVRCVVFIIYFLVILNSSSLISISASKAASTSNRSNTSKVIIHSPKSNNISATDADIVMPSTDTARDNTMDDKEKVCIIGSGNWASAISIIIGNNCQKLPFCHDQVNMYVYDELISPCCSSTGNSKDTSKRELLSNIINTQHINVKYLPNIHLPTNIKAVPNLLDAINNATLLIFCLPHQFLQPILTTIRDNYHLLSKTGCRGVSLIKGMDYDPNSNIPILISKSIQDTIQHDFSCGVLMGANVANGVAKRQICESTLATNYANNPKLNQQTLDIFHDPTCFRIQHTIDIYGTEACGALKNIVALGCGFIDSLYEAMKIEDGSNTKAALIRIGLLEMKRFCFYFLNGVRDDTFYHSCGVADLITTCYSGRNYKCAREFGYRQQQVKQHQHNDNNEQQVLLDEIKCQNEWKDIEKSFLNGQKLQGTLTCQEVYMILSSRNLLSSFPLFTTIYDIAFRGKPVHTIVDGIVDVSSNNGESDSRGQEGPLPINFHYNQSKL